MRPKTKNENEEKNEMKVELKTLVSMFVAMGYKTASRWTDEKLRQEVAELPVTDVSECGLSEEDQSLFDNLVAAVEAEEEIEITGRSAKTSTKKKAGGKGGKSTASTKKTSKKTKKGAKASGTKKTSTKEEKKQRAPGVIDTIVKTLKSASAKNPVTKSDILDVLTDEFPDRDPEGMKKTINVQVPSRLRTDRELEVQKNENGYYLR